MLGINYRNSTHVISSQLYQAEIEWLFSDENYLVAGRTRSRKSNGDFDAWVLKLDPKGQVLWDHHNWNQANTIASTPDGGSFVGGSKSAGRNGNAWLLKLDATGNLEWEQSLGNSWSDHKIYARMEGILWQATKAIMPGYVNLSLKNNREGELSPLAS